jgi:hypothetical protein
MFPSSHKIVQKINPNIPNFYNSKQVMCVYLQYIFGCLFCCPLPADVFMTTHATKSAVVKYKKMLKN